MRPETRNEGSSTRTIRFELSWRTLLSVAALGGGIWLILQVWPIILLLVIALILAGTFSPLIDWLEKHTVPRPLGLGICLLGLIIVVVGLVALLVPALANQVSSVIESAPEIRRQLADWLASIPVLAERSQELREAKPSVVLNGFEGRVLGYAGIALQTLAYSLITIVLSFYLLADHERVRGFLFSLLPRSYHIRTARVLINLENVVGGYVRGQALTSLLIGIFTYFTLLIAGVPNAFALAALAAAFDLIPLLGPILAVIVPTLMSLPQGTIVTLGVFIALFIYNQIENHILLPRVYGQTMRLSPVAVLLALLTGGQLFGLVGALLALPIAAAIRVLVEDLRIELPGEHIGEKTERAIEEAAEQRYFEESILASGIEAATLANTIAQQLQQEVQELDPNTPLGERHELTAPDQAEGTPNSLT